MNEKSNAPVDWSPQGAAFESAADCTTFADDLLFAWEAMGFGALVEGMTPARLAMCCLGACLLMVGCAGLLLLGA